MRFYVVVNSGGTLGYSGGDGGVLGVSMVEMGGDGLPSDTVLGSATLHPRTDAISFPLVKFDRPAAGRRGALLLPRLHEPEPAARRQLRLHQCAGGARPGGCAATAVAGGWRAARRLDGRRRERRRTGVHAHRAPARTTCRSWTSPAQAGHIGLGYMESWISNPKPIARLGRRAGALHLHAPARGSRDAGARARAPHRRPVGPLSMRLEDPEGKALAVVERPRRARAEPTGRVGVRDLPQAAAAQARARSSRSCCARRAARSRRTRCARGLPSASTATPSSAPAMRSSRARRQLEGLGSVGRAEPQGRRPAVALPCGWARERSHCAASVPAAAPVAQASEVEPGIAERRGTPRAGMHEDLDHTCAGANRAQQALHGCARRLQEGGHPRQAPALTRRSRNQQGEVGSLG